MRHHMLCTGVPKLCVYVRATVGLVGRDVAEALSRGSDEGSRKLVVGCFLSTWLCPSSSKPDSTPCCLLCLLLSSRSFPKKASWTWRHKAPVTSLSVDTFLQKRSGFLAWHQSRDPHHHGTERLFRAQWRIPGLGNLRTDQCEIEALKWRVMFVLTTFWQHLRSSPPVTYTHKSSTILNDLHQLPATPRH